MCNPNGEPVQPATRPEWFLSYAQRTTLLWAGVTGNVLWHMAILLSEGWRTGAWEVCSLILTVFFLVWLALSHSISIDPTVEPSRGGGMVVAQLADTLASIMVATTVIALPRSGSDSMYVDAVIWAVILFVSLGVYHGSLHRNADAESKKQHLAVIISNVAAIAVVLIGYEWFPSPDNGWPLVFGTGVAFLYWTVYRYSYSIEA